MKIAIPTNEEIIEGKVALHFGQAKNFLVFDTKTDNFKIYQNPETAGKSELPPPFLNKLGVRVVICFSLGPRAVNLFKKFGIKTEKAVKKNIFENIKLFQAGKEKKDIF